MKCSLRTVNYLLSTGKGPSVTRLGPRIIRFREDDYLAWLDSNRDVAAVDESPDRDAA